LIKDIIRHGRLKNGCFLGCVILLLAGLNLSGRTIPDASDATGFFSSVADKLLRSTFNFGITNIPVCSNGIFVYTPAVQRLLQLSANIYDAANTNTFPVVFRPLFAKDATNNIFVIGYQQVTNVAGASDPQLSPPYDITQLSTATLTPIADANGPVNVYGVPWIIGAKKGLPGFNQFYLTNDVQVTRKLMCTRASVGMPSASNPFTTNQMYVMSINTGLGISFWNAYNAAYPRPLTVYASDAISETLTAANNSLTNTWFSTTNLFIPPTIITAWPGSQWSGSPPNAIPQSSSFLTANWSFNFLPLSVYRFNTVSFDPVGSPTFSQWETTTPPLPPLPQFGLAITNYLQAFILDGNNVIDYVQLRAPSTQANLNQVMADPDFPSPSNIYYQWSTNVYRPLDGASWPTYGVINQLWVSANYTKAPPSGGQWSTASTPMGITTPAAESVFFDGFFVPAGAFQYQGKVYYNTQLSMQAPYTPTRTIYSAVLLQANDPLVHYLASDLNAQTEAIALWAYGTSWPNGVWRHVDDLQYLAPLGVPLNPIGGRYQPWGQSEWMAVNNNVDTNGYNLAYRDPLVWGPDNWNFPTNLLSSLGGLGQVHRGTPWQTLYLKSANVLQETVSLGSLISLGTNTWMQWSADLDANDAALTAPVNDWRLAGLLVSLLNTNNVTQLLSVNDSKIADWQNVLNGLLVYSNSTAFPYSAITPSFDTYVMASNSPPAWVVANGLVQARVVQPSQNYYSLGDFLAVPELSVDSPWLNTSNTSQLDYGITDAEYEAIPAQLLPLLRSDSIGVMSLSNGGCNLQFSGSDAFTYEVQASTDLVNWQTVSTNQPMQGCFNVSPAPDTAVRFYRSVLVP